jgi:flagellar hook-basal body complex protein FliE
MKLSQGLALVPNISSPSQRTVIDRALKDTNNSFGETLNKAITDVNDLQAEAGKAIDKMVTGEATDLHSVMIAVEKAKTSFELLMEIRNKAIDTYREIMKMQV